MAWRRSADTVSITNFNHRHPAGLNNEPLTKAQHILQNNDKFTIGDRTYMYTTGKSKKMVRHYISSTPLSLFPFLS
jgi:hypothetical protein